MNFLEFFRSWISNNKERAAFKDAWMDQYGNEMGGGNSCRPYHEKVAYEIFSLTKRVEDLEKKNKNTL